MSSAVIRGIITLLILSVFALVPNTGTAGGAVAIGQSDDPLADGFTAVFGSGATTIILMLSGTDY